MTDTPKDVEQESSIEPSSDAGSLLARLAHAPEIALADPIGQTMAGRYKVVALLGKGGMGRVYEADDLELGRRVAIKFLQAVLAGRPESIDRFLRERTVTAQLEHPSIVPVYDSGLTPDGAPFYVMRVARGEPLDRLLEQARTLKARLALLPNVIAIAEAIAFAHGHGIVHRDIKPANVLVGAFGETLVADWGLAKRIRGPEQDDGDSADSPEIGHVETRVGAVLGTPAYMAPEQREGRAVDARSDVYALGAMLFQLVTGHPPRERDAVSAAWLPPTERLTDALADLIAIVRKAIAVDPDARYQSASELGGELRRLQTGQIVGARIYTRAELLRRWARRHRASLSVAGVLGVVLVAVVVASVLRIVRERNIALAQRSEAEAARRETAERNDELVLLQARAELTRDPTSSLAWLKRYPASAGDWATAVGIASDAWSRGVSRHVWDFGKPLGSIAFSPDGRTLGVGASDGTLTFVDVDSGARRTYTADDGVGDRVVFSPDGTLVATSDGLEAVRVWDPKLGTSRRLPGEHVGGSNVLFSADGTTLVVRNPSSGARMWRMPGGEPVALPGEGYKHVAFVPGRRDVVVAMGPELSLVDVDTGRRLASTRIDGPAFDVVASGDGRWIAASRVESLALWNPATGAVRSVPVGKDAVRLLTASADGRLVVSCGRGAPDLWVFDVANATARQLSSDERCTRQALSFSPDDTTYLSAGFGGALRLHDIADGRMRLLLGHDAAVSDAAFSPDGRLIASAGTDHTLRVWRRGEGDLRVLHGESSMGQLAASDDLLVSEAGTGAVSIVNVRTGSRRRLSGPRASSLQDRGVLSRDGRVAAWPEENGALVVLDVARDTRRKLTMPAELGARDVAEALSSDGSTFAQSDTQGVIRLVDMEGGRVREIARTGDQAFAVAFSSDDRLVAAGGRAATLRVWDVSTGSEKARMAVRGWVWNLAFSRDATKVIAACTDGIVRVLDLASGDVRELVGHVGSAGGADFMRDGARAVSSGVDGTIRFWDLATGVGHIVRRDSGPVGVTQVSADGSFVMSSSGAKTWVWDARVVSPFEPDASRVGAWIDGVTSAEVDTKGRLRSP